MDVTTQAIWIGLFSAMMFGLSKTGFPGVSMVGIVVMAMAFPSAEGMTPGMVLPMLLVGDVMAVKFYREHTDWKTIRRLLPAVIVGMIPGALLMGSVSDSEFKVILGAMILVLLALDRVRIWGGFNDIPHKPWFAHMIGATAGFVTFFGNAAGPVMAIYLIAIGMSKEKFMGCAAWFFFIVNMIKVAPYIYLERITFETLQFDLYIVPGMIVGALIGRPLFHVTPQKVFDPLVLFLAALGALKLVGLF